MHIKLARVLLASIMLPLLTACTTILPIPVPLSQASTSTASTIPAPLSAPDPATAPALVHATPEDAVTAYLNAIATGDLSAALAAAAPQRAAGAVNFVAHVDRLRAYLLFQSPLPANDDFFVELNRMRLEQQLTTQITSLVVALLTGDLANLDTGMSAPVDAEWADEFAQRMNATRLANLEVLEIAIPDQELMASDRYLDNANRAATVWGGDEWTERIAIFTFEGEEYLLGFTLIRYGDAWYVQSQSSPIAGTPATGVPIKP